ncbi:MAG: site-2 protease family protein [Thermomicrobiales bacterium]|mgnify:FL=1|jgi:Zn-dependent protease
MISRPHVFSRRRPIHPIALRGIPVRASPGWITIVVVLTIISADLLAPDGLRQLRHVGFTAAIVAGAIMSLIIHELAHDAVARRRGMHLRAIILSSFGALTDDAYRPENPANEVRVAAAGPAASGILAIVLGACSWIVPGSTFAGEAFRTLALINTSLAILTLLPAYPLDGGRILRAFLWYVSGDLILATRAVGLYGRAIGFGIVLAGLLMLALNGTWSVAAVWLLFAYWSISQAAREGFTRTLIREGGRQVTADEAGLTASRRIAADRTIDAALDEILQSTTSGPLLVQRDGDVIGLVSLAEIQRIPRATWDVVTVGEIASSLDDIPRVGQDTSLVDILDLVDASTGHVALLVVGGRIVGAVTRQLIYERIREHLRAPRDDHMRRNSR